MSAPTAPLVIAVDCSTTAAKAIVVDAAGRSRGRGVSPGHPQPGPHWFEQDATQWWSATDAAIQAALQDVSERSAVAAVCVTHQRESFVCLDEGGTPLRPAILWLDGRAEAEVRTYGTERVELLSGKPADITPGSTSCCGCAITNPTPWRAAIALPTCTPTWCTP